MLKEFRAFIMRGNVLDLAVGIIIGGAFGGIVNSLVKDIIMPPIGLILGKLDFSNLFILLGSAPNGPDGKPLAIATLKAAQDAGLPTLNYGLFITAIINFLIIGFAVFMIVRAANSMQKKQEEPPAKPPEPSTEEKLLTEIRDLLKEGRR